MARSIVAFSMQVVDIAHYTGRGTVLSGIVQTGRVAQGHRVVVRSPLHAVPAVVAGIEVSRRIRGEAAAGDKVGILVRDFNPKAFPDGIRRREDGTYRILSLTLTQPRRAWWQFWRPWL